MENPLFQRREGQQALKEGLSYGEKGENPREAALPSPAASCPAAGRQEGKAKNWAVCQRMLPCKNAKLYSLLFIYLTILKYLLLALTKMKNIGALYSLQERQVICTAMERYCFLLYIQRKIILIKKCFVDQKKTKSCKHLFTLYITEPRNPYQTSWHLSLQLQNPRVFLTRRTPLSSHSLCSTSNIQPQQPQLCLHSALRSGENRQKCHGRTQLFLCFSLLLLPGPFLCHFCPHASAQSAATPAREALCRFFPHQPSRDGLCLTLQSRL